VQAHGQAQSQAQAFGMPQQPGMQPFFHQQAPGFASGRNSPMLIFADNGPDYANMVAIREMQRLDHQTQQLKLALQQQFQRQ
jgi:hypothetical protein